MNYKCLGCDTDTGWDGEGLFSYTCACGATIFYRGTMLALPISLVRCMNLGKVLPHLNGLLGESAHTSPLKEVITHVLRAKGCILMEECEKCQKDGTLRRKQAREEHLATMEADFIIRWGGS